MLGVQRQSMVALLAMACAAMGSGSALSQAAHRDQIADMLSKGDAGGRLAQAQPQAKAGTRQANPPPLLETPPSAADPRAGSLEYEQAQRLMRAIDSILQDTARSRGEARKLPSRDEFLVPPIWTETREDRESKIKDLLDATLAIVTDVPVVEVQKRIEALRKNIRDLDDRIVRLREKQLTAPKDGVLPGLVTDTVDSLGKDIEDARSRIENNRNEIAKSKREVFDGLARSGIQMTEQQVDLLLDGVLSGDLVRLVAVFNSAKAIDAQLAKMMAQSGENVGAARRYFAMHAALFAMIVHAQDATIAKVDSQYLPKLDAITRDIAAARKRTADLLRAENRADQRRALEANRESQRLADEAAKGYRRYLVQQREQIMRARQRAAHDLKIADNTFETVEASYQLRQLMKDSSTSFEAIQRLEAPTFEQIFRNEELRREFENLTRKLDQPAS
jgi:polyhydroxyalkanoate synthesis regulator phasin